MAVQDITTSSKHTEMVDCRISEKLIKEVTKDVEQKEEVQALVRLVTKGGFREDSGLLSPEMHEIKMALKVMSDDFIAGELVDNPRNVTYRPFRITSILDNENMLLISFGKLHAVIDCYSEPGKINWIQLGRGKEVLDLRHLLYRVSKLSIKTVANNLINNILIGINIFRALNNEEFDNYKYGGIEAVGISVVAIKLIDELSNRKYQIDIQYGKISLWENRNRKAIETENINEVIEQLYIEILTH